MSERRPSLDLLVWPILSSLASPLSQQQRGETEGVLLGLLAFPPVNTQGSHALLTRSVTEL